MTQKEKREYLIKSLLAERGQYSAEELPADEYEQKRLLRALFNLRPPKPAAAEFLTVQDGYLQEEIRRKGITRLEELSPVLPGIYLWQGDITTLECGAVVNAANSRLLGCFAPCHGCIDNAVHTFAGIQLRLACAEIMKQQGENEETGKAKITPAFNLPSDYVIHTVGPVVSGRVTQRNRELLASCYRSCMELAQKHAVKSIAFCCISTGEFHFPNEAAAETAVRTVMEHRERTQSKTEVIFNVFKDADREIYKRLLAEYK